MTNGLCAPAVLVCCPDDTLDWCPACDRLVSAPLMVWAFADLYICHECAGSPRPWHDWTRSEWVRG